MVFFLQLLLTISQAFAADEIRLADLQAHQSKVPQLHMDLDLPETRVEALDKVQDRLERSGGKTVILTSDRNDILESVVQRERESLVIVPFGKAASFESQSLFQDALKTYREKASESFQHDRIGLMVMTINLGFDSFYWIHAANLSTFEKTGNVLFTVVTTLALGINKDLWAHATRPIQDTLQSVLGLRRDQKWQDLSLRFLSSMTLATALNLGRIPFLSADSLVQASLTLNQWTIPVFLGFVSTVASLGWSENIALINQSTQPISKFIFRRIHELRSLFLGTMATTAMLFNPSVYGSKPWVILISTGALGLVVYLNNEKITKYLESRSDLRRFLSFAPGSAGPVMCQRVYSI